MPDNLENTSASQTIQETTVVAPQLPINPQNPPSPSLLKNVFLSITFTLFATYFLYSAYFIFFVIPYGGLSFWDDFIKVAPYKAEFLQFILVMFTPSILINSLIIVVLMQTKKIALILKLIWISPAIQALLIFIYQLNQDSKLNTQGAGFLMFILPITFTVTIVLSLVFKRILQSVVSYKNFSRNILTASFLFLFILILLTTFQVAQTTSKLSQEKIATSNEIRLTTDKIKVEKIQEWDYAEIPFAQLNHKSPGRNIAYDADFEGWVDNTRLIYRNKARELLIKNIKTNKIIKLTNSISLLAYRMTLSQDRSKIIFLDSNEAYPLIYIANLDGSKLITLEQRICDSPSTCDNLGLPKLVNNSIYLSIVEKSLQESYYRLTFPGD